MISTYSRVRRSGRRKGTPYQPSETCGPERPSPSGSARRRARRAWRPPSRWPPAGARGSASARSRARSARSCPSAARAPRPRPAPGLGDPDGVEPQLVAEHREVDLLLGREPGPVGEEESDAHRGASLAGSTGIRSRAMDLTLAPEEQAFRDELRGWLEANDPGREPEGDEAGFEFRRDWQRKLYEAGWAGVSWPKEYGGRGATLVEQAIFNEEVVRARAAAGQRPRPRDGRPDGDRARHRGAEAALPRADPLGRGDLVPGLLRARLGLGPGVAEDEGRARRRRLGGHRARRSGPRSRTTPSGACWWRAPTRRCPSTRA